MIGNLVFLKSLKERQKSQLSRMSNTHPFSAATSSSPHPHNYPGNIGPPSSNLNPNSSQGILYPVASSGGRGFIPKPLRPSSDQTVTVANPGTYPQRPTHLVSYQPPPSPHLDASFSNHRSMHHHHHLIRSQQHHHYLHPQSAPSIRGLSVASAHPKVATSPSPVSDSNGFRNLREKKDDAVAVVRDRKVRISDGASLYVLCRSWLRNGSPEECQPQYGDSVKSLPRPLPVPPTDINTPKESEAIDDDAQEDEGSVDQLSAEDLLKRHLKRAKRVRARLKDERAKRIERYKTRLALLLPPLTEQSQNDASGGK